MRLAGLVLALSLGVPGFAQTIEDKSTEHRTFSGVRELILDNVTGSIDVTASSGSSVEGDITRTLSAESQDRIALARKEVRLDVAQEGGLLRLLVDGPFRHGYSGYHAAYDFKLRVPRDIRLDLRTVNKSKITVQGTSGDFNVSNVNGGIEMNDIQGSGSVHTVNGPVKVTFARNPTGATSFKSVNGALDVSFRPGLNADVKMKTMNGGLFTDFPVSALPIAGEPPEQRDGKFVFRGNRRTGVRIGGGGPELDFETLNGDVLIKNRER
ncbi:MAG: hypothetical protein ABSB35_23665 [Bryobacteraceae bacterium]|jgi:DUF4097 and DUF4098 domain-containing protein YvlB